MVRKGNQAKKPTWKLIQKKPTDGQKPASIKSQETQGSETKSERLDSQSMVSSVISNDEYKDAIGAGMEDSDEDDSYFQEEHKIDTESAESAETDNSEQKVQETSVLKTGTTMSVILPALQHSEESDVDSDIEKETGADEESEKSRQDAELEIKEPRKRSAIDVEAEIEALGIASPRTDDGSGSMTSTPAATANSQPTMATRTTTEKPATYEPVPAENKQLANQQKIKIDAKPTENIKDLKDTTTATVAPTIQVAFVKDSQKEEQESNATEIQTAKVATVIENERETGNKERILPDSEQTETTGKEEQEANVNSKDGTRLDSAGPEVNYDGSTVDQMQDNQGTAVKLTNATITKDSSAMPGVAEDGDKERKNCTLTSTMTEVDASTSTEQKGKNKSALTGHLLATILPAVEESVRSIREEKMELPNQQQSTITPEDEAREKRSLEFEFPIEDPIDLDMFKDNVIAIKAIDPEDIPVNILKPYEQEKADEALGEGMKLLFDNHFMKAKNIFQTKASVDPLYALGLGAMAFIKAFMTYHEGDIDIAMTALATAYTIAKTQINKTETKKPFKDTVSQYLTSFLSNNSTGLPNNPPSMSMPQSSGGVASPDSFLPNGVLRAHVVKAECCLLMGILQMTQESVVGYLKCGLNIRKAYNSYSIVWQEYKRMGQEYVKYMDRNTVSGVQFGIGAVHLILSSMPPKILKIFSVLGWKSDKQLGFALLKLCLEGRSVRAPLASLTLLAYYSVLTSFTPQLYSKDMLNPAIECLLDAQNNHPNSCFFLFFAARIARVARNLPLSTQSFMFAAESSRGEWAEVAMKQMSDYEIGFNLALQLDWDKARKYFDQLVDEKYWSPAFSKYFVGACYEMLGQRTEAILAFAEVVSILKEHPNAKGTYIGSYVLKKVEFFQKSGYQDMDFSLPGLEVLLVLNTFSYMEKENLEKCLKTVQDTLTIIYEREKMEYTIRLRELVPTIAPPDYYDQRAVLLLMKASILNSLERFDETIAHLNWILDHKDCIKEESWVVPFAYWECGVTSWGLGNYKKSRKLWQMAMSYTKYEFEYRLAVRLSLALSKCDEVGITQAEMNETEGTTTNGRKRMPLLHSIS